MRLPRIEPAKLVPRIDAFDHPDWLFELKHNGFRGLAYIVDRRCDLISRRNWRYKTFEPLRMALAKLRVRDAILDGEIVCLDSMGRSVFKELLYRRGNPVFYAFDLLWLNGRDLRGLPLLARKEHLRKLIRPRLPLLYADHIEGAGIGLFQTACVLDLEGIVCKRRDSAYASASGWMKVKNPNYTKVAGRHEMFDGFKRRRGAPADSGKRRASGGRTRE